MQGEPQTVYADVLFLLNFLLTWAMIRCTGILTGRKTSGWREAAGSLAGGAGAMLLLFSPGNVLLWLLRILTGGLIGWIAYGFGSWRRFFRLCLTLFLVSFLIVGAMAGLMALTLPADAATDAAMDAAIKGGIVYFRVSPVVLIVAGCGGCLTAYAVKQITEKRMPDRLIRTFTVRIFGREERLRMLVDTGNRLTSFGTPVAVLTREALSRLLPPEAAACLFDRSAAAALSPLWKVRLRLIPCRTAAGETMLSGFPGTVADESAAEYRCIFASGESLPIHLDDQERGIDGVIAPLIR